MEIVISLSEVLEGKTIQRGESCEMLLKLPLGRVCSYSCARRLHAMRRMCGANSDR